MPPRTPVCKASLFHITEACQTRKPNQCSLKRQIQTFPPRCQQNNPQPKTRFHQKIKDSILILEAKQGPLGKTAVGIGQGICTAGLIFGSGTLFYFSLFDQDQSGFENDPVSSEFVTPGALKAPEYVKERVHTAYMYMANSLAVSSVGALASFRMFSSPYFLNAVSSKPLLALGVTMGSQFLVTMLVRALPYKEGFGLKQAASITQAALIGLSAAPMYLLGAQSVFRAGFVTAGVVGGLTGISTMVPHDTFDNWEQPLRIAMYAVFISFMSLWFIPRNHHSYTFLYRVAMHGGLIVFPAYYLHNSKLLVKNATYSKNFDPINSSMSLYTDILNIYGRLAFLLPPHYFISTDPRNSMTWNTQTKPNPK